MSQPASDQGSPLPPPAPAAPISPAPVAAPAPADPPAWRSPAAWVLLLAVTLASIALDLASKSLAFHHVAGSPVSVACEAVLAQTALDPRALNPRLIPPHDPVVVVPSLLEFTLVLNPGAVFGMGPGQRWFFVAFTAVALGFGLGMFAAWTTGRERSAHAAIGLLLGGGLGNLYDRLAYGCVRDFLHPLPGWRWPFGLRPFDGPELWPYVSNVADLFLLVGILTLLVHLWRKDRRAGGTGVPPVHRPAP